MTQSKLLVLLLIAAVMIVGAIIGGYRARMASAGTDDPTPTEKGAWGRAIAARLKGVEPQTILQFDEREFEIAFDDGAMKGVISLANYWSEAQVSKLSIDDVAARIHRSRVERSTSGVLPALRERVVFEVDGNLRARLDPKLGGEKGSDTIPYQTIGDVLALGLVEDRPETMQWLSNKGLSKRQSVFEAALATATRAILARPAPKMKTLKPGAYRFEGDEYGSTHFLLGSLDKGLSVQGSPVAIFVSRETVLVTGSEDPDGLKTLLNELTAEASKPRAWIPRLLRHTASGWELFQPTPITSEMQRRGLLSDYERQTNLLRSVAQDDDDFPAAARAVQNENSGTIFTIATLTETVDTLLPEVELVDLNLWENDTARPIGVVRFAALREKLGPHMVKTALWPTRYRVTSFPTPADLEALKPQHDLPLQ